MDNFLSSQIWERFIYGGETDPGVDPRILDSWKKCKDAGVDPMGGYGCLIDEKLFLSIRAANNALISTALPIMQSVFEIVRDTHCILVLTDSVGYILESMGDEEIKRKVENMRFTPGVLWSAQAVGTNAISIALDYDTAIATSGSEHFCKSHHTWTCAAAPIHGIDGEIIGCIDLSGDMETAHDHSLALILAIAYGIEAQLKLLHSSEMMRAALESSSNGILLLDKDYRPAWTNSQALNMLGFPGERLRSLDFRELVPDVDWDALDWRGSSRLFADDVRVVAADGPVYFSIAIYPYLSHESKMLNVTLSNQTYIIKAVNKLSGNKARCTFDDIVTQSPEMKKALALAKKYANYDGNILIEGETGTGKELVAQAIHNAGNRAAGPFVAVNCASLTRESLEEELFGYESGARDNSTEGNPGRFELANRGTLFLDGISDMPLEFQSKLLRVVDTHTVSRLGSTTNYINLDIRIIASSNKNLLQAVEAGIFRRDLYERLSALKLDIPPLRMRTSDIGCFALSLLERLNAANPEIAKEASPDFMSALINYEWPGNIRELQNGVERAFYSSKGPVLNSACIRLAIGDPNCEFTGGGRLSSDARDLSNALSLAEGDVAAAAEKLGISRATMYRRLKKFGIDPKRY